MKTDNIEDLVKVFSKCQNRLDGNLRQYSGLLEKIDLYI